MSAAVAVVAAEKNDWQEVLASCAQVAQGLSNSTVLLLGDRACGKSELVARLKAVAAQQQQLQQHNSSRAANDAAVENVALGYTFVDLLADDQSGDVVARLNVWSLEG